MEDKALARLKVGSGSFPDGKLSLWIINAVCVLKIFVVVGYIKNLLGD